IYQAPGDYRRYRPSWWRACYATLQREHHRAPFDILLSQSAGALGYLALAHRELDLPSVVVLHGTLAGGLRTALRGARSLRGIYRLGRLLATQLPQHFRLWRAARDVVAHWVAVSDEVASGWRREIGVPAGRISVIPNGIDVIHFAPDPAARAATRAALGIPPGVPVLIAVGRLEQDKGFQIAVRAMASLRERWPAARLIVVGDGAYRTSLEREIATRGLGDRVSTLGYRPNTELPRLLAAADLFLMPSLCHEAFPLTIVEALASGLPVLASDVGGIPSAIDDGRTGRLLPMGAVPAWAAAIDTLLADERRRRAMGALARQVALARFSRERMVAAFEQVLRAAARPRASAGAGEGGAPAGPLP
ncbi:MAG TPA: glycosyltransferase family 4 protein, partial [Roseiflexaceae bacterium]|nr:glycosyltransferase family 4 protein [Roseiflexaceae bacterium]